ncbi:N-acetyl-gamma-glutamyl-phosphate reductase [Candidatus Woesearchaeota archaeon]|nr:N-acetyl-gamma-glutamyl-phosphate reductase [Candidatus Woesearchaeota archaeon]
MIKVGILGASGYSGNELVQILVAHKKVEIVFAQSKNNKGKRVSDVYKDSNINLKYQDPSLDEINKADIVFLALPKEEAAAVIPNLKKVIIDLSPSQRFNPQYVYGLPEAHFDQIKKASYIANPGCYATACILGILPLLKERVLKEHVRAIAFDCKSGYSGGGRTNKYEYEENVIPYALTTHYQYPEIGKFVSKPYSFTPHVVDAFRGLIATIHVFGVFNEQQEEIEAKYKTFYEKAPCVKIISEVPTYMHVKNTPYCIIGGIHKAKDHLIVISAIDNLLKGAASQAVENMNIRFGFKQEEGLL